MDRDVRKVLVLSILVLCLAALAAAQDRIVLLADYGAGSRDRVDVTSIVQSMVRNRALNFQVTNDTLGGDPAPEVVKDLSILVREPTGRISEYRFVEKEWVNLQLGSYYRNQLPPEAQQRFDSLYARWLEYQRRRARDEAQEMERRMKEIMYKFNIPPDTPFEFVASSGPTAPGPDWNELRIEQASYGVGTRTSDVTSRLQNMVRNNSLQVRVTNDVLGGDPAPGLRKQLLVTYFYQGRRRQAVADEKDFLRIP